MISIFLLTEIRQSSFRLFLETNFLELALRERALQMPLKDRGLSDREYRLYHSSSPHCYLYRDTLTCSCCVVCLCVCCLYYQRVYSNECR
jgi:hypothetical protein